VPAQPIEILLVEDNPGDVRFVREMVRDAPDLSIRHVDRLAAGIEHLSAHRVDVVLLDLGLPDSQGLDTLRAVMAVTPSVPVVVLTGHDDEAVGQAAVREGAQDYLVKGRVVEHALTRAVRYAIERGEAQARLRHLNLVLRAIRNVNQLIVHEKDPARLIQEACNLLVETRGYRAVWIAQCRPSGAPSLLAQSGWGDDFEPFAARLRRGEFPPCWDKALAAERELLVLQPPQDCPECPLNVVCGQEWAVVAPLRHGTEQVPRHGGADR
jgi:DNA-binding NarL/FixJ family response regulator